jgi:hypothetical protein
VTRTALLVLLVGAVGKQVGALLRGCQVKLGVPLNQSPPGSLAALAWVVDDRVLSPDVRDCLQRRRLGSARAASGLPRGGFGHAFGSAIGRIVAVPRYGAADREMA